MQIDSAGNVGIGTSSPQAITGYTVLTLNNSSQGGAIEFKNNNTSYGRLLQGSSAVILETKQNIPLIFGTGTSSTERMRIDSSGNLILKRGADVGNILQINGADTTSELLEAGITSGHVQFTATHASGGSNTCGFIFRTRSPNLTTERMRLDSDGRLLLGTTTEGHQDADNLTIVDSIKAGITIRNTNTNGAGAIFFSDATSGTGEYAGYIDYVHSSNFLRLATASIERMRITNDGGMRVGMGNFSAAPSASNGGTQIKNESSGHILTAATVTTAANHHLFFNPNGLIGSIKTTGSSTSFNTSSDYRLKENVVDIADGIDRIKQLQPKRFNFIADADTTVDGFLAHEAQAVVPEAVTGTHNEVDDDGNAVMQGIDQSKLVPLLTAALQEAIAKIETLEQRLSDAGIA